LYATQSVTTEAHASGAPTDLVEREIQTLRAPGDPQCTRPLDAFFSRRCDALEEHVDATPIWDACRCTAEAAVDAEPESSVTGAGQGRTGRLSASSNCSGRGSRSRSGPGAARLGQLHPELGVLHDGAARQATGERCGGTRHVLALPLGSRMRSSSSGLTGQLVAIMRSRRGGVQTARNSTSAAQLLDRR